MIRRSRNAVVVALALGSLAARAERPAPSAASAPSTHGSVSTEERIRRLEMEVAELKGGRTAASQPGTSAPRPTVTLAGYVELFYQWNFNAPSNGITNFRGYDNRHNAFTLANAVLDATGSVGPLSARLALQVGHTPDTYYAAEPVSPGAAGAGPSDPSAWRIVQQAIAGYRAPLGRGLLFEGGIFLSPIGPESLPIKDQWNWSRSNLFFGLPAYHAGLRVSYPMTDSWSVGLAVYNGWNCVVDNNAEKSIAAHLGYTVTDKLTFQLLYFTGVERAGGAPEGSRWRHLFDAYLTWYARSWLSLMAHGDAGFERNAFGTSWWAAGALYGRARVLPWLHLAARGDLFREGVASNASGAAAPIFWPASWVSSATGTVEVRPHPNLSFRVEYRHDHAAGAMYFRKDVGKDGSGAFLGKATYQDTLTLGMAAWF